MRSPSRPRALARCTHGGAAVEPFAHAIGRVGFGLQGLLRAARDDVDDAPERIRPVQRGARALHDLDPLDPLRREARERSTRPRRRPTARAPRPRRSRLLRSSRWRWRSRVAKARLARSRGGSSTRSKAPSVLDEPDHRVQVPRLGDVARGRRSPRERWSCEAPRRRLPQPGHGAAVFARSGSDCAADVTAMASRLRRYSSLGEPSRPSTSHRTGNHPGPAHPLERTPSTVRKADVCSPQPAGSRGSSKPTRAPPSVREAAKAIPRWASAMRFTSESPSPSAPWLPPVASPAPR